MSIPREWHTATVLNNGKVLVAGGRDGGGREVSECELYDPLTGNWTSGGSLNFARH